MSVTLDEFNKLSEVEQYKTISDCGKILINYLQGDSMVNIYKVNNVFVKIRITNDIEQKLEVYEDLSRLKLYES